MGPVGVAILLWAFIYAGVMFSSDGITDPVLAEGGELYAAQCAGCHGGSGQGGTGRPLHDLLETFPDPADHIAWVTNGSPAAGTVYGANGHISQDGWPAMPGFGNALTPEEILAIVRYEREVLNGETDSALATGEASAEGSPEGGAAGGEDAAEGDPADDPSSEAESEGGDVGTGDGSSAEGDEETLTDGNEDATDDSTPTDSGTGAEGEGDTGE
jgi:mono/diheme cytochrome c family protein